MQFITREEMLKLEENASISVIELMANAGRAIASELFAFKKVVIVCGSGNNGGDGYAAAHLLPNSQVVEVTPPKSRPAQFYHRTLTKKKFTDTLDGADCIVDAILGTGVQGEPTGAVKEWIEKINAANVFTLSVDVPSGIGTATEVQADITLSLELPKVGMQGKTFIVKSIGLL